MRRLPVVVSAAMVAGVVGAVGGLDGAAAARARPAAAVPVAGSLVNGIPVSYAATLTGAREGTAVAVITVMADRVFFALRWKGFVPESGHLHEGDGEGNRRTDGPTGKRAPAKVALISKAMPDTVRAAAGQVELTDPGLAGRIVVNPTGFTVDLRSAQLPGGSVQGRLTRLGQSLSPLAITRQAVGGAPRAGALRALASGGQEVPKGDRSKVGDPDGRAMAELRTDGTAIDYAYAWFNIQSPSKGHLHKGAPGRNGDVVLDFFNRPVPDGIFAVSGRLEGVKRAVVKRVQDDPQDYYANIHTAEFPDGAVRGQLA
ncbi:CHRD domain-containing protein [Streptomyces sp. NPDC019396]|uniref:CHRD domain-containing protein n=1 Tax=Streptomyces sp. NPDC019396 TaxID=3154687 RepID=UPI0033CE49F5